MKTIIRLILMGLVLLLELNQVSAFHSDIVDPMLSPVLDQQQSEPAVDTDLPVTTNLPEASVAETIVPIPVESTIPSPSVSPIPEESIIPSETIVPTESSEPMVEPSASKEASETNHPAETMDSNTQQPSHVDQIIERSESEYGMKWERIEQSEAVFSMLKQLDQGILTNAIVTGDRVAQYTSPHFGYITQFHFDDSGFVYYCIDPTTLFHDGEGYIGSTITFDKISFDNLLKISQIMSFGYGFDGKNTVDYFIATQILIWEVLGYYIDGITLMDGSSIDISAQKAEILNDIVELRTQPSFHGTTIKCPFNAECIIPDGNHVLSTYYEIDDTATSKNFAPGYPYIDDDNNLHVKYDTLFENVKPVRVKSNAGGYYAAVEAMLLMTKPGSQDLLGGRLPDPIEDAELNIVSNTQDLTVDKVDEYAITALPGTTFQIAYDEKFTHLIVPNCDVGLVNEEDSLALNVSGSCSIYNRDTRKFETKQAGTVWTVGSDGALHIDQLLPVDGYSTILNTEPGVYWIREIDAHQGYVVNTIPYRIDLNESSHYSYMNLNRDVDLTVYKMDQTMDKVYLDGAEWVVFEVPHDGEVHYEQGLPIGLTNASNDGIPQEGISETMCMDYSTLISILPNYQVNDLFIWQNHLYRVNSILSDRVVIGVTNVDNLARIDLSETMIPADISVNDTFTVNGISYILRMKRDDAMIIEDESGLLYIADQYPLSYEDVSNWNVGDVHEMEHDNYTLVEITPFQAVVDAQYRQLIHVDEKDDDFRSLMDQIEAMGLDDSHDAIGQTITLNGNAIKIVDIVVDPTIESIVLEDTIEYRFTVENPPLNESDLPETIEQSYGYTMYQVIKPQYEFTAISDQSDINGLTINVSADTPNPWLSFETVQSLFPWQTNLISNGSIIERSYVKAVHDPVGFETLLPLYQQDILEYTIEDQVYQLIDATIDDSNNIISITVQDVRGNLHVVDSMHPLIGPEYEYIVQWECTNVIQPAFIARLDSAYDQYFITYPYQKHALIGFCYDPDKNESDTYINVDTNNDGQMIDFHGVFMDLIQTHPFNWEDLKSLWSVNVDESFTLLKPRPIEVDDAFAIEYGNQHWLARVKDQQQYPNVTTTLLLEDSDAPDISNLNYSGFYDGLTIEIDGTSYTWFNQSIMDPHYLGTLMDSAGNEFMYWIDEVSRYDQTTMDDLQLSTNTFDILIPLQSFELTYTMVKDQLDQMDIPYGYNGDVTLILDHEKYGYTIQTYDADHIVLVDEKGTRFTLDALPLGNALKTMTFFPLNQKVDISDLFEMEDGQTIILDAPLVNGQPIGTLDGTMLTLTYPSAFQLKLIESVEPLAIPYDQLKDLPVNEPIEVDGQTIIIHSIDDEKIIYSDEMDQSWTTLKKTPLSLEKINEINTNIPLVLKGIFEYMDHEYRVESLTTNGSTIASITYCDVISNECFINDQATPQTPYTVKAVIDCLTTADAVNSLIQKDFYPIFHGVSGGVYLRTVDIDDHNRPLADYSVTIYEDPDGLYPIETLRSDNMGVVDVSHLPDGSYYWKMPGVMMLQEFEVNHQPGGLTIENLKYGQTYMACEIVPPTGYMVEPSQDICHTFTVDETMGYTVGIDHQTVTLTNQKRDIDVTAYKIDSDDAKTLLNGALFEIYDVTYEGENMCDYQSCDDPQTPMVQPRTKIATLLSGGIYIHETEYRFINPLEYSTLLELLSDPKKGDTFTNDDVVYTITDIWFNGTENQHILYTDGTHEYNGSKDELMIATNYDDVPMQYVTYQFAQDAQFESPYYAQTDENGEILFIPLFEDENGENAYRRGTWYYRKVNVKDANGETITGDLSDHDPNELVIDAVGETKMLQCNPGRMDLSDIDYGSSLQWCEIRSPLNYLHDPVCETMVLEPSVSFDSVNHYKRNERIIRYRRKKRGYRVVRYQTLRLRPMADTFELSDCALDWYRWDYLYTGVSNGRNK